MLKKKGKHLVQITLLVVASCIIAGCQPNNFDKRMTLASKKHQLSFHFQDKATILNPSQEKAFQEEVEKIQGHDVLLKVAPPPNMSALQAMRLAQQRSNIYRWRFLKQHPNCKVHTQYDPKAPSNDLTFIELG